MINPKYWLRHWRAQKALGVYPLYDVPYREAPNSISREHAIENFEYFMRVQLKRLSFFQDWLWRWFRVQASLDGDSIRTLDRWVESYGGGLICDDQEKYRIFEYYQPIWVGTRAGYNVAVDIGIFVGEFIIQTIPSFNWFLFDGHKADGRIEIGQNMFRPHIRGFMVESWSCDMFGLGLGVIMASRDRSQFMGKNQHQERGALEKYCKNTKYLSKLSYDDNGIIVIGNNYDRYNEQI